ncbi:MAG: hypothetical protein A2X18_11610 [Bacteroidetes bacterium GWF2_40_14]|nr:MAG: hypothetical protein A2X18_11610 [Bacteroidetes bacterium GWF2_40_14]
MEKSDLRLLISIDDRVIAGDIQSLLEESEIYTILSSDNPASSVLGTYGFNSTESIDVMINEDDYKRAVEILSDSPYNELVSNV